MTKKVCLNQSILENFWTSNMDAGVVFSWLFVVGLPLFIIAIIAFFTCKRFREWVAEVSETVFVAVLLAMVIVACSSLIVGVSVAYYLAVMKILN